MKKLNSENVPEPLRYLIPLAEKWNIGDDGFREQAINNASSEELTELVEGMRNYDQDEFDKWLAYPYADYHNSEYIAFSCLRQAYDSADLELWQREHDSSKE
jgi:hypothetical protein